MILFSTLLLLALSLYKKEKKLSSFFIILGSCLFVYLIFVLEYYNGDVEYLISDGFRYFDNPEEWIVDIDRALWGYVNYWMRYFDVGGGIFIKILNIPILLIFLHYLQKLFPIVKSPTIFILFYPYLLYQSISNLRDLLISLFAILVIHFYFHKNPINKIFTLILIPLLYTLRPFMAMTLILAILFLEYLPLFQFWKKKTIITRVKQYGLILTIFLSGLLAYPLMKPKLDSYIYNVTYTFTEGYVDHAIYRKAGDIIDPNNIGKTIFLSHLRYIFTPMPQSIIFEKILQKDPNENYLYGRISVYLRLLNQLFYYGIFVLLIIKIKSVFKIMRYFTKEQWSFILWTLAFFPIYSLVHFGGSHQRLKLPFQILLLIVFLYSINIEKVTAMNKNSKSPYA